MAGLALVSAMLAGSCAEPRLEVAQAARPGAHVSVTDPTKRPAARLPLKPLDGHGHSGALILARLGSRPVALLADEDSRVVRVIEPDTHQELSHVTLSGKPSQLVIAGDGRAYVALRDASRVVALEVTAEPRVTLQQAGEITTASEPVSLAVTPAGDTLLVASAWGKTLALFRLADLSTRATIWLPREPRGVVVSADGRFAYVSHAVGPSVSRVALDGAVASPGGRLERSEVTLSGRDYTLGKAANDAPAQPEDTTAEGASGSPATRPGSAEHLRVAAQGFAIARLGEQTVVPLVLVHPNRALASQLGAHRDYPAHQPALAMIDSNSGEAWLRVQHRGWAASRPRGHFAGGARRNNCFLPRAVAVDSMRGTLLVACLGSGEILAYDASPRALAQSWRGRWRVPAGPLGLAVDAAGGTALVWSQFDRSLSTIELPKGPASAIPAPGPTGQPSQLPTKMTSLPPPAALGAVNRRLSSEAAIGRKFFHSTGQRRGAADGRSCASCHPDGRQDGLIWPTPYGPRRTLTLTGPLDDSRGHQADGSTGTHHPSRSACPQLGEQPLTAAEVRVLVTYLRTLPAPTRPSHGAPSVDSDARMASERRETP